jgi:hypothetical protein
MHHLVQDRGRSSVWRSWRGERQEGHERARNIGDKDQHIEHKDSYVWSASRKMTTISVALKASGAVCGEVEQTEISAQHFQMLVSVWERIQRWEEVLLQSNISHSGGRVASQECWALWDSLGMFYTKSRGCSTWLHRLFLVWFGFLFWWYCSLNSGATPPVS